MAQNPYNPYSTVRQQQFGPLPPAVASSQAGFDPSQWAAIQSLQNPNNDQFNGAQQQPAQKKSWLASGPTLPGIGATFPELLVAALGGGALGVSIQLMSDNAMSHASKFESWPGIRHVNNLLRKISTPKSVAETSFYQYANYYPRLQENGLSPAKISEKALLEMKERSLQHALPNFHKALKPHGFGEKVDASGAYEQLLEDMRRNEAEVADRHTIRNLEKLGVKSKDAHQLFAAEPSADLVARINTELTEAHGFGLQHTLENTPTLNLHDVRQINQLKGEHFEDVVHSLHAKVDHLEAKKSALKQQGQKLSKEDQKLLKALIGIRDRVEGGIGEFLGESYQKNAMLRAGMREANLGPIGRTYVQFASHMRSIFGGETMTRGLVKKSAEEVKQGLGKRLPGLLMGSLLGGMFIIAPSIHAADEAKPGEKNAAFWENFIGFGIFNMLGWEFGRHLMDSTKLVEKVLGRHSLKHPFFFMPKGFGKQITMVGFVTELLAMFVFGSVFQKAGEWISHKIFGKPTPKDEESAPGAQPPPPAAAMGAGSAGGMAPGSTLPSLPGSMSSAAYAPQYSGGFASTSPTPGSVSPDADMMSILQNPIYQQSTNFLNSRTQF